MLSKNALAQAFLYIFLMTNNSSLTAMNVQKKQLPIAARATIGFVIVNTGDGDWKAIDEPYNRYAPADCKGIGFYDQDDVLILVLP